MDNETRGFIEKMLDQAFKMEFLGATKWFCNDFPVSSLKDLALGYVIGHTIAISRTIATFGIDQPNIKDEEEIKGMIKRRIPEVIEKIERELNR